MQAIDARSDATEASGFPRYTVAEAAADRTVHLLALPAAIGAVGWLVLIAIPVSDSPTAAALAIYGCGLIGMITASAAYSLSHTCRRKELLRRVDHAVIFVMIAGTYTPFAVYAFRGIEGLILCAVIWSLASIGVAVTLAFPRRFERSLPPRPGRSGASFRRAAGSRVRSTRLGQACRQGMPITAGCLVCMPGR
jgi:hemolysin III